MAPSFLIIGAMKCATSTLHAQLGAQPGIFTTETKEPNYFGDDAVYARGPQWYASLFDAAPAGSLAGESSTQYSKRDQYPLACERIQKFAPDVKLVYVMRNPMARLISHYLHEWTEGSISASLDRAILDHPRLMLQSCYAWQLAPYLERFGPDQILPVFFERIVRRPGTELERIARFLGSSAPIAWREELGAFNRTADRRRNDPLHDLVRKLPGGRSIARLLPTALRLRIERRWRVVDPVTLSSGSKNELEHVFDRDLARLGRWLGTSLSWRSYDEVVVGRNLSWTCAAREAA